ncbi:2-methylcitrate dehydratase PrpD [Aspergillus avenaceus]|uniref:2-methylcitrate dehydratase PrpD n=1 Tax=Aspergillus avenaceus TaxID=36643 RepID=A0A5N6U5B9_ASPAV|nr:2-methylcitrate dehydratase PrpD [Aspergillus avenaceus]
MKPPKDQPETNVTETLSEWIADLKIDDIPPHVRERARYLVLDGIGCGLVGARAPWSEVATKAMTEFEPEGYSRVIGQQQRYGPLAAALLNGSYIQAMELDDYHSKAPLHSASVVLPALFAAAEVQSRANKASPDTTTAVTGAQFLLSAIVGFETGPRAGNGVHGGDLLTRGWHSGPIFGCPASAAAASKLFQLPPSEVESAIGIACTQAGGLMSAQYEGMVKRMQHAFGARNGLLGALLARSGYGGIKKVFDRPYGGFLAMFSQGNGKTPAYQPEEVVDQLGSLWHTEIIRFKLYACVGGCHGQIEVLQRMQERYPARFAPENLRDIAAIKVYLSEPIFKHDGWKPERPLTATGAQMSAAYIGATQLVDRQVLTAQFEAAVLDRDEVWELTNKTTCYHSAEFDKPHHGCGARIVITFADGFEIEDVTPYPKGFDPPLDNSDILGKFRKLAGSVLSAEQVAQIEDAVLGLEGLDDVEVLLQALVPPPSASNGSE